MSNYLPLQESPGGTLWRPFFRPGLKPRPRARRPLPTRRPTVEQQLLRARSKDKDAFWPLLQRANRLTRLEHPNIQRVTGFNSQGEGYCLNYEPIDGITLEEIINFTSNSWSMPLNMVASLIKEVCEGLEYIHGQQEEERSLELVHGDLSPARIMITYKGAPKLINLNLMHRGNRIRERGLKAGDFGLYHSYSSPEQLLGLPISPRSDIYQVGVILWELLAGRSLFQHPEPFKMLCNIMGQKIPRLRDLRPDLPRVFVEICDRALKYSPTARFQHARQISQRLVGYLMSRPCPPSTFGPLLFHVLSRRDFEIQVGTSAWNDLDQVRA